MGKGTFLIYDADLKGMNFLTDAQIGKVFRALGKYRLEGIIEKPGNNPAANMLFQQLLDHISINEEKYKQMCKKNSEAARKRWHGKAEDKADGDKNIESNYARAYSSIETNGSECVYDNENDNDIDYDYDYDNDANGAKRENKRKNFRGEKKSSFLYGEPSYDIDAFTRKTIGLKYKKIEKTSSETGSL